MRVTQSSGLLSCAHDGCSRVAHAKGLCTGHYKAQRRGYPLQQIGRPSNQVVTAQSDWMRPGSPNRDSMVLGVCRLLDARRSYDEISKAFGLSRYFVQQIRSGRLFPEVGDPEWRRLLASRESRGSHGGKRNFAKLKLQREKKRHDARYRLWSNLRTLFVVSRPTRTVALAAAQTDVEKFHSRYTVNDATGCWEWNNPSSDGYGKFGVDGVQRPAHRVAWALLVGPIPQGMVVRHRCPIFVEENGKRVRRPNPGCVNPKHLAIGSDADNKRDWREDNGIISNESEKARTRRLRRHLTRAKCKLPASFPPRQMRLRGRLSYPFEVTVL